MYISLLDISTVNDLVGQPSYTAQLLTEIHKDAVNVNCVNFIIAVPYTFAGAW